MRPLPPPPRAACFLAAAALLCVLSAPLRAQELDTAEVEANAQVAQVEETTPQEAEQPAPAPSETIPTLPETTVIAPPFPATPLGEETVLTPTPTELPVQALTSSLTVISEEQIRRSRQNSVLDVLRTVPGLDAVQQGGPGRLGAVFLRGANSAQTKVLLDGIPLNDPSNASRSFDFSTLSVDNIERIEVLRGPQSILYGTDAIGGVVNIITKRGSGPPLLRLSTMGGSFETFEQTANVSGGDELVYYSLGASYFDQDGFSAADKRFGNREEDGYRNGTVSGRFGWTPAEEFDVDFLFRYTDADAEVDDFSFALGRPVDNLIRDNASEIFYTRTQARWALFDGLFEQRFGFNLANYRRTDSDPGFADPLFKGQTRQFDWRGNLRVIETDWLTNILTFGADYLAEDADSTSVSEESLWDRAFYIHDQIAVGERWISTLGTRWDDYSQADSVNTYRFTSAYRLLETGTTFHGAIGTGFRAPSIAELLGPFGNPALRPEQSKGWEYGARQALFCDSLALDATYFRNDFEDLVVFDFSTLSLENVGKALSTGVELTAEYRPDDKTVLAASYTRTDTRDRSTDLDLLRRPRDKYSVWMNRSLLDERANVYAALQWVGDRLDTGQVVLQDYTVVNASFWYDLTENVRLFARVDNIFDEKYEEVFGFATPRVSAYGGVVLTWGGAAAEECCEY